MERNIFRASLMAGCAGFVLLAAGTSVHAQTSDAPDTSPEATASDSTVVVVTGFRKSLLNATKSKQSAVNFGDSISAEEIGKFPDINLAESLQRIPGVQLTRDSLTGEGTQVAIRALPPSFTNVTIGGNRIQVASFGQIENPTTGREIDLDLFPSELFSRIDVSKTPSADQFEGGIAGSVNLSNARPFDHKGQSITASLSDGYQSLSQEWSPRGAIVASKTWDKFGILVGFAGQDQKSRTDGFESIGWSNANLACTGCDNSAGNNFTFASVVPANSGNGLTTGDTVDYAALNPGITLNQLTNALIPRLGRPMYMTSDRKRGTGVVSLEWRPTPDLRFALDGIYGKSKRHLDRYDMNWLVRNSAPSLTGGMVPINVKVDSNNVVTSGTFANSTFFVENRTFDEDLSYQSLSPSMVWQVTDNFKLDAQLSANDSKDVLVRPSFNFATPQGAGITVNYTNGSDFPTIATSVDLGDPNLGWTLTNNAGTLVGNIQLAVMKRATHTRSGQVNFTYDFSRDFHMKFGVSTDKQNRSIVAYDNSAAALAAFRAAVPASSIGQYMYRLQPRDYLGDFDSNIGYSSFAVADMDKIKSVIGYDTLVQNAPVATPANQAITQGNIEETYDAAYLQINDRANVFGGELKYNAGIRWVSTDQTMGGPVTVNGNQLIVTTNRKYKDVLPSFNMTFKPMDKVILRFAASKTMSRPDPNAMLPGVSFIDPSAQTANAGNPDLKPFYSNNLDLGGEYYTGGLGYVGISLFQKNMTNFTYTSQITKTFADLGIPFSSISPIQQAAINANGGPDAAKVAVTTQVNSPDKLKFNGVELTWVQPLDFLTEGLGFSSVYTKIDTSGVARLATGVPPVSYNFTGYYEHGRISIHASYAHADRRTYLASPQNGLPLGVNIDAHNQVDLSASYTPGWFNRDDKLTLDVVNLTNEPIKQTFGYYNATYSIYNPGVQVILGWQGKF